MKLVLEVLLGVINKISSIIGKLYNHKKLFRWTGLFATRKFPKAEKLHKYGILVSARNEEAVIGKLIDSIKNQDYPQELIQVFVMAHNCTDNTVAVASAGGGGNLSTQRFKRAYEGLRT